MLWVAVLAASLQAQSLVVPGSLVSTEGNSANADPFSISMTGPGTLSSQRYQQVYDSSQFPSLPTGGVFITGIAFRIDGRYGTSFSSTLPDIQINLSTTSAEENTMSSTFANNVGADDTVVYMRGPLALSGTSGSLPRQFNVIIMLSTPFHYDPANGNLLLDVRNYGGGVTTFFDATSVAGDGISRVMTSTGADVNSLTANYSDTLGLVTKYIYQAVPPYGLTIQNLGNGTLQVISTNLVPSHRYVIETSTNLINWASIVTNGPIGPTGSFTNTFTSDDSQTFYRGNIPNGF